MTLTLSRKIDALDNWCLRRILNIHWSEFVTNDEIRSRTGQPLLSDTVRSCRLSFFGHLLRADPWQDHHRALEACIMDSPGDWRWRDGRPRQSWLRTVEADLRPINLRLATAKRRAQDRSAWRLLVAMATSSTSSWRRTDMAGRKVEFCFIGLKFFVTISLKVSLSFNCYLESFKHVYNKYFNNVNLQNSLLY